MPGEGLDELVLIDSVSITVKAKNTESFLILASAEVCSGAKARFAQLKVQVKDEVSHYSVFLQVDVHDSDCRATI